MHMREIKTHKVFNIDLFIAVLSQWYNIQEDVLCETWLQ